MFTTTVVAIFLRRDKYKCRNPVTKRAGTMLAVVQIMKTKPLILLLVVLLLSSHSPLAFSQQASSNDWSTVQQLKTNEKLVVRQKDGKQFKGEMIEATD